MSIVEKIEEMINSPSRIKNAYVSEGHISIYVRITKRYVNGSYCDTIDIANVVVNEDFHGRGIFKKNLRAVEHLAKKYDRIVYVESVLSELLVDKLPTYGYTSDEEIVPSFHKIV